MLESDDLFATTETCWDKSHDWSVAIDGYRLFTRDAALLCREGVSKGRDTKNNKKGFYRYVSQKSKVKESIPPQECDWQIGNNG